MKKKFATRAIHTGCKPEPVTGAVMTPIFQTSTFVQESPGKKKKGYAYARTHNPTRTALETNIAKSDNILTVSDNTFATPFFQQPLKLGVDIVVHSTTKYLNGHSDMIGGAVITNDERLYDKLQFVQNAAGAVPGPFDCFLVLRGIKTLAVRMERHAENAMKIAQFLENNSKVRNVIYPGLESHPQHELAKKQMSGFGGMITFFIKGGLESARRFLERVEIFALAESLGGVESLIEHPAIMTHASLPEGVKKELGISDELIRISVGIENVDDLIDDLEEAL
jgi:cystathionine gamma-lyase